MAGNTPRRALYIENIKAIEKRDSDRQKQAEAIGGVVLKNKKNFDAGRRGELFRGEVTVWWGCRDAWVLTAEPPCWPIVHGFAESVETGFRPSNDSI